MGGDTIGEINFYNGTIDKTSPWMDASPKLVWTGSNYAKTPTPVTIHDLRGKEDTLDLDKNAFEIHKYEGYVHDEFNDNSEAQEHYYNDITTALKKRLGASRIIVFNHIIRSRGTSRPTDQCNETHKNPVFYPHVDNDPPAAHSKVQEILGEEEAKKVVKNRFQIINIWRPLGPNPITNTPLTLCDYRSLDLDNDVHISEVRRSVSTVSLYVISHNIYDAQKWCYLSDMRSDEMFVFKIFDSNTDVAQFAAHTAFNNKQIPHMNDKQSSIEVRCLVLYD